MQADEIRELTNADIVARLRELEEERFRLTFRSGTEPLEQPLRVRAIRRDIARLRTVQTERTRTQGTEQGKPQGKPQGAKRGAQHG